MMRTLRRARMRSAIDDIVAVAIKPGHPIHASSANCSRWRSPTRRRARSSFSWPPRSSRRTNGHTGVACFDVWSQLPQFGKGINMGALARGFWRPRQPAACGVKPIAPKGVRGPLPGRSHNRVK